MRFKTAIGLALGVSCVASLADASTIATFDWVSTSVTGGTGTPSGVLTLTLPNTVTTQTFNSGVYLTNALALDDLTSLSFTFADGDTIGLSNVNQSTSTLSSRSWYSSFPVKPGLPPATKGIYLINNFILKGSAFGGTFQLAEPASNLGTLSSPGVVSTDSNNITPGVGKGVASVDAGYWELVSFQPNVPVPLPASLWLLASTLAGACSLGLRPSKA
jgi:hypothetical protein